MNEPTILHDDNWSQFADATPAGVSGVPGILPRESQLGGVLCAAPAVETYPLVPRDQWEPRIAECQAQGVFVESRRDALAKLLGRPVIKNQAQTNFCHLFSLTSCIEVCRDWEGQPYVELAPESLAGAVGWRNAGGTMDVDIQYAAEHGVAARQFVEPWHYNPNGFQAGWQDDAKKHRPLQFYELGHSGDLEAEVVTLVLAGLPIYAGWMSLGHAMMIAALRWVSGAVAFVCENSWGTDTAKTLWTLTGRNKLPSIEYGCFAPRTCTWSQA